MKLLLFLALLTVSHAAVRILPSFLTDQEVEQYRAFTMGTVDECAVTHRFINYTYVNADLHRRIRHVMNDRECTINDNGDIDDIEESEVSVSTIYATTQIHQDSYVNVEPVCNNVHIKRTNSLLFSASITHYTILV
jgi:hypothetical protein